MEADTEIVVNYDCDVILPMSNYEAAYKGIIMESDCDVVYPYGDGMYQKQVAATDGNMYLDFLESGDYNHLDEVSNIHTSDFGWVQFFRKSLYRRWYGE